MTLSVRRVLTGHDKNGKAIIVKDDHPPIIQRVPGGSSNCNLWLTTETPSVLSNDDPIAQIKQVPPPLGGSIFRIIEFVPDKSVPHPDAKQLRKTMGVSLGGPEARHPGMHRTESIDYALILDGEIDMLVDEGEVHLKKGDVVIQGACNHAWANRGDKPCTVAFILIGAKVPWAGQGY
jgi:hypothetical protein